MQFYFAMVQGATYDGDTFGIVMQEGIGSKYKGKDRASEDHININGEVFKLDQSDIKISFDQEIYDTTGQIVNLVTMKTTSSEQNQYPGNSCELSFRSELTLSEGV